MALTTIRTPLAPSHERRWPAAAVALLAALLAVTVSGQVPLLGPLLVALVLGAVVANTPWADHRLLQGHGRVTKLLLRLGVVLLGLKLSAHDLLQVGPSGIAVVIATVVVTYGSTIAMGRVLRLDRGLVALVAAGFSICGAAAIAAVDDAVKARQRDVALAVALVTIYGSAMILVLPWLADLLGLSNHQAAVWAGASIHEVAQVIATASIIGGGALAVATVVKLGRVMLLAPVYVMASRQHAGQGGMRTPLVPWFVAGFALAVAVRSTGAIPTPVLDVSADATSLLLAAGMFGLGLGIRARDILPVPIGALVLATCSTVVAAGTSLLIIVVTM